ncbi:hypothetical protein DV454_004271 [Geotrichum candidum]|nr:hypothetical protein DV454_004271 [Geotrichum candidum]
MNALAAKLRLLTPRLTTYESQELLKKFNFNLEKASFHLLSKKSASFDPLVPEINAVFNKYKDQEDPNDLGIEGTIAFVQDLGVDLEDPVTLALAYKLYSPRLGSFPRSLFILGWVELG